MVATQYRVLVVDDEEPIRKLVAIALRQHGFHCDVAADGIEAERLSTDTKYDAVVTDLKMPNMHGHALILALLEQPKRPAIIALTGLLEPKLAKDLLLRGVDDVLFKPIDFSFLALKVKALLDRQAVQLDTMADANSRVRATCDPPPPVQQEDLSSITISQLNCRLAKVTDVLPISNAAVDVFKMTRGPEWKVSQIAAAVQRDPALTVEVLRLANSAYYNTTGQRIVQMDDAVRQIGHSRLGELALATSALAALTHDLIPWLDTELTWKRSMGAGLALERLVEVGGHQDIEEGLLLSAIMHPLGRVALGRLFPDHYERMVSECDKTGESLEEQERRTLPTSHAEVMTNLLASWKVPPDAFLPLKFSVDDFPSLMGLSEPMRTRAELVKLAILFGRLAAGNWQCWDLVQLPSESVLKRLRIVEVHEIINQTKVDLAAVAEFDPGGTTRVAEVNAASHCRTVPYCHLSQTKDDLLVELLPSMGLKAEKCSSEELRALDGFSIINCLSAAPPRFAAQRAGSRSVAVTSHDSCELFGRFGQVVPLPCSYGRLKNSLLSDRNTDEVAASSALVEQGALTTL
jgi:DNA-binding response OmpR family regulator